MIGPAAGHPQNGRHTARSLHLRRAAIRPNRGRQPTLRRWRRSRAARVPQRRSGPAACRQIEADRSAQKTSLPVHSCRAPAPGTTDPVRCSGHRNHADERKALVTDDVRVAHHNAGPDTALFVPHCGIELQTTTTPRPSLTRRPPPTLAGNPPTALPARLSPGPRYLHRAARETIPRNPVLQTRRSQDGGSSER